jgi:hypothetical protein
MQLKEKTIKDFQKIIKRDYGQILSEEEANELKTSLLRLTRLALNYQIKIDKTIKKQNP